MELRELEAFTKVVQSGSFTKAAEALSLTQPAITRQVAALEKEFQTKLLNRLGRSAKTTDAGAVLYEYAIKILTLTEESRRAVADVGIGIGGTLRIGASSTTATYLLPSILKAFTEQYPGVKLSMLTGPTARVTDLVAAGDVDLAVVMDHQERPGMTSIELAQYELVVIVPPNHRLARLRQGIDVASLADEVLIVMQPEATLRRSVEAILAAVGTPLRILMELDNVESIKKMVEADLGISIIPGIAAQIETRARSLVSLPLNPEVAATQTIRALHVTGRYQSEASRRFVSLLQVLLPRYMGSKETGPHD